MDPGLRREREKKSPTFMSIWEFLPSLEAKPILPPVTHRLGQHPVELPVEAKRIVEDIGHSASGHSCRNADCTGSIATVTAWMSDTGHPKFLSQSCFR